MEKIQRVVTRSEDRSSPKIGDQVEPGWCIVEIKWDEAVGERGKVAVIATREPPQL